MTPADLFDVVLAGAVLVVAALALALRRRGAVVTTFLVLGVLLAAVWARLGAPDVALAEAVIASGVTAAMLVTALTLLPEREPGPRPWATVALGLVVGLGAAVALTRALVDAARPGGPDHLGPLASRTVDEAAISHPVTVVLLELRAYDTLLEVAVLAAAALVAVTLRPEGDAADPTVIDARPQLVGLVAVLAPFVVLLAGWLLVAGTSRPGGAFQSGAMLAGLLLLLHLTGSAVRMPTGLLLRVLLVAGLVAFVGLGALTAVVHGSWLAVQGPGAATVILLLEALLAVGIGVALAALVLTGTPTRARGGRSA